MISYRLKIRCNIPKIDIDVLVLNKKKKQNF